MTDTTTTMNIHHLALVKWLLRAMFATWQLEGLCREVPWPKGTGVGDRAALLSGG